MKKCLLISIIIVFLSAVTLISADSQTCCNLINCTNYTNLTIWNTNEICHYIFENGTNFTIDTNSYNYSSYFETDENFENSSDADGKIYNSTSKKIKVKSNKKIPLEYILFSNTDYCSKTDCYAEILIKIRKKNKLFNDIFFKDDKGKDKQLTYNVQVYNNNSLVTYDKDDKETGVVKIKITGLKQASESVDWVLNTMGLNLTEWAFWRSWQDWYDDFEAESGSPYFTTNRTFWENFTMGCVWNPVTTNTFLTGYDAAKNYYWSYLDASPSNGACWETRNVIRVKQDFNDTKNYIINITMASNQSICGGATLRISDYTTPTFSCGYACSGCSSNQGDVLLTFNNNNIYGGYKTYTIIVNGKTGNWSIYNQSGSLLNSLIETKTKWYLTWDSGTGGCRSDGGFSCSTSTLIWNFSVTADKYILVNLNSPTDKVILSNYTTYFSSNFTTNGPAYNISNATLYIWYPNSTIFNTTTINLTGNNNQSNISVNLVYRNGFQNYTWNYLVYSSANDGIPYWALTNRTLMVNDTIPPTLIVNQPSINISSVPFNISITPYDYGGISYCYYNVTRGASTEIANTQLVAPYYNDTNTLSGEGSYVIKFFCNDTAGLSVNASQALEYHIIIPPNPGGGGSSGGGGGAPIILTPTNWTMSTDGNTAVYDIQITPGSTRVKQLVFSNLGVSARKITLTCENVIGTLCANIQYEKNFELPALSGIKTSKSVTLDIPKDAETKDNVFNMYATDDEGNKKVVTFNVGIGNFGTLTNLLVKAGSSTNIAGLAIPYLLVGVLIGIGVWFGSYFILRKKNYGASVSFIIAIIAVFLSIVVL